MIKRKRVQTFWCALTLLCSVFVFFGTFAALCRTGLAMTDDASAAVCLISCEEEQEDSIFHIHSKECYTLVQGNLICEETAEDHAHTEECYTWTEQLTCEFEENSILDLDRETNETTYDSDVEREDSGTELFVNLITDSVVIKSPDENNAVQNELDTDSTEELIDSELLCSTVESDLNADTEAGSLLLPENQEVTDEVERNPDAEINDSKQADDLDDMEDSKTDEIRFESEKNDRGMSLRSAMPYDDGNGTLIIKKEWRDYNNNPIENSSGEINVLLKRKYSERAESATVTLKIGQTTVGGSFFVTETVEVSPGEEICVEWYYCEDVLGKKQFKSVKCSDKKEYEIEIKSWPYGNHIEIPARIVFNPYQYSDTINDYVFTVDTQKKIDTTNYSVSFIGGSANAEQEDTTFSLNATISAEDDWTKTWPVRDGDADDINILRSTTGQGQQYAYYVIESPVENYSTTYCITGAAPTTEQSDAIRSGEITVINKSTIPEINASGAVAFRAKAVLRYGTLYPPLAGEEFTFRLSQVTGEGSETPADEKLILPMPQLRQNDAYGNVVFDDITFLKNSSVDDTGDYWFLLEQIPGVENIIYDDTKHWIHVTVSYDGTDTLICTKDPEPIEENDAVFSNNKLSDVRIGMAFAGIDQIPEDRRTALLENFRITAVYSTWVGEETQEHTRILTLHGDLQDNVSRSGNGTEEDPYLWIISRLPESTEVSVTASHYQVDDYCVTVSGASESDDKTCVTGTLQSGGDNSAVLIINTYSKAPGALRLTKVVNGENTDPDREFRFWIYLIKPDGAEELNDHYNASHTGDSGLNEVTLVSLPNGERKFHSSLKSGDTITVVGIPAGTGYRILEDGDSASGYTLTDATGADSFNNGEITGTIYGAEIHFADITAYNTPVSVVLNLSKEDFSTHERLPGAEFALRELDPNSSVISYRSNGSYSSETDENGCSSFELAEGRFYELKEEKPPKGYLITGSMKAYFKVMNGKLSMIEAEEDVPPSDWTEATSTADGTTFSLLSADSDSTTEMADAIITVYNYQGSMLPTTGGMGAEVIAMTGMVLLVASGVGFCIRCMKKKRL